MIKGRSFNLTLYTETLARRAFYNNRDAAVGIEDYKQIAAMAVYRAKKRYKKSKQVKFETFAICIVKNSLITAMRRQRPQGLELPLDLAADPDDDFLFRVSSFIRYCPSLSYSARKVANGLVGLWNLPTVSLTSFRRSLGMSKIEFSRACEELRTRFQGEEV